MHGSDRMVDAMKNYYVNAESAAEIYEGRDLGLSYTPEGSIFKVWAPTASAVSLVLYNSGGEESGNAEWSEDARLTYMLRREGGVWQTRISGDLKGKFYMYRVVYADGTIREATDPYSFSVSANGLRSAIIDMRETNPEGWELDAYLPLEHPADAVIYELHVRDFSIHETSGISGKGKYKAFTETGLRDSEGHTLGIDHLSELGITHVHLLPVFDFQTVDELQQRDAAPGENNYNWGYDPQHYNAPEGSYSTNASDPAVRIREFKEMVQALHRQGLSVVMDVVYNHTYSVDKGPFEAFAPGYFYRHDYAGRLSNGSGVGNELATERPMVRKFIKDSLRHWAAEYHIDGFRFDLMGLIDTATMREITEELRLEINPNLIVYGEPWTGGDSPLVTKTLKGAQRGKGFAVFNDNFRSAIKGDSDGWGRGFVTGEMGKEGAVAAGIIGAVHDFADSPAETVNYTTAHDNLNLWDKILAVQGVRQDCRFPDLDNGRLKNGGSLEEAVTKADPYIGITEESLLDNETVRRSLLAGGIVLTSQGVPFLHAGDEMLRSKFGDHNSYRSGDAINAIRWSNKARFLPVFEYYKSLIALRKSHPAFRLRGRQEIERSLEIYRCDGGVVSYILKNHAGGDVWKNIVVLFNANPWEVMTGLPTCSEQWNVVVDHTRAGLEAFRKVEGTEVQLEGLSMMVLYDECGEPRPRAKRVEVHYERADGDYSGWNLWVWGTGIQDGQINFRYMEDGRAVAVVEVLPETRSFGYILRVNDWEARDGSTDKFIDCSKSDKEVKVLISDTSPAVDKKLSMTS